MATKKYKNYLIDLDGTMYRGTEKITEAHDFIKRAIDDSEVNYFFLTNNTTKTPQQVADNLTNNHDIPASVDQIITPSLATAFYLRQQSDDLSQKSAYVIGEVGLKKAVFATGIQLNEFDPDFVIVGLDTDVTYHKFELATLAIKRGAKFIGTNADTNLPNERGMVPGAGSVISLVETSTQQKAMYIGKPDQPILDFAISKFGLNKSETIMVGDNYNTDIRCGLDNGVDSLLVYTGVSTKEDILNQTHKPTFEIDDLSEWEF
ncbi:haloacid dehalogenase [Companilactobacillus sp. RD055328]|uniref:TIGR01457 family HAD-type hydrolase n=1 Tax=Companilactobacillus sp. RD055328 TaxID=2916634 RepID=UPI00208812A2|nr:TIGR01457 family HAD-type hydrolase [Companilactobacillus sp. RD055328]GKQ42082.1 haloacid dehalogenase [Companilactobacillus sp. RD055328]